MQKKGKKGKTWNKILSLNTTWSTCIKFLSCIYFSWYESENLYCMNIMQPTDYFVVISKQQKVPEIETGVYIPIN